MQATYGIGGHGLLMAMSPACRVQVTADGELVILQGTREVARVIPGDVSAHAPLTFLTEGIGQFGDGGPTLELEPGVAHTSLFAQIDHGLPSVQWSALAAGVMVALPAGVVLVPAHPDDEDPFFELHAPDAPDEFISFLPREVAASEIVVQPASYQRVLDEGTTTEEGRAIRYTECAYERDGQRWRQMFFAVPVASETVVVRAQAAEANVSALFTAARAAAATLIPLGPPD